MIAKIDGALHMLYRWCGYLAGGFIVLIGILVLINIVSRLMNAFIPGMTEGAGYCMAAAGALGLAYTFGEHGHIRVTMLIGQLRGGARYGIELAALLTAAALSSYLAWYVVRMVFVSYDFGDRSDGSDELLIWIPQVPMALGFVVFAISLVHAVFAGWAREQAERADDPDDPGFGEAGH